ncbi:BZ3500_MvSof-1268-A1-R1_Chr3-2g06229 [Microbotryum saponariae]|uniref:50S ribosomal protein L9, chloroplastic n=1 Tax=Microbotryum saponariae TaxID=289078 RepID=A0A2X0LH40_9BASI|nr:BZ3500_MvSof-1268-A1-R1_Chr3-2g06229 [Microbotryum saponariae]SDA04166.1 BZ3501_MvSof-1269-A2-R1_Chr3-2g05920 [Microbotryum saponariae]
MSLFSRATRTVCNRCQFEQKRFAHKLVEIELLSTVPSVGRRGERHPVSRGFARHLYGRGQALLVLNGRPASAVQDMMRSETRREATIIKSGRAKAAKADTESSVLNAGNVLDEIVDRQPTLLQREENVFDLLKHISTLEFTRLTHQDSDALFGSVTTADILTELRSKGINLESTAASVQLEAEDETSNSIEKNRIKRLGSFECVVAFKESDQNHRLKIEVVKRST